MRTAATIQQESSRAEGDMPGRGWCEVITVPRESSWPSAQSDKNQNQAVVANKMLTVKRRRS
jgi:hypothetical protein